MKYGLLRALIEWRAAHAALGAVQESYLNGARELPDGNEREALMDRINKADEALEMAIDAEIGPADA